jgi:nucleotide-binding universal stress UspA family protein
MQASITLLHAFHFPVITDAVVMQESTIETWEKDNKDELHKIATKLQETHPKLKISTLARLGFAVDEILALVDSHHIDLIVMGSKGTGSFGDDFLGNVTSDVITDTRKPVLIIPPETYYKPIKRIVFACENENLVTEEVASVIKEFAGTFQAQLYILDVIREYAAPLSEPYEETNKIKAHFNNLSPIINIIEDEKVVHGINKFAKENDIDMVIMIPGHHNFFERMFTEIHTRHMAHDTHSPLLIIPSN